MKRVPLRHWLAVVLLVAAALLFTFQPAPPDPLGAADRLFADGHYYAALAAYESLAPQLPVAQLRLGMVRVLRGERVSAERAIRTAMQRGLAPADYHLALLYLGRTLADDGRSDLASRTWRLLADCRDQAACAYQAPGRALAAAEALRRGDYRAAEADYRAALATPMPPGWAASCRYHLALLLAPNAPDAALAFLAESGPAASLAPADPLLAPLLPLIGAGPGQLAAVLAADPAQRPQLLGQLYVNLNLYGLAEEQFARVDSHGPAALNAAAYAAYTRWRAGATTEGLARLEALVAAHPDEPRARTLLALAYLTKDAGTAAHDQIDALARLRPGTPEVELAWANWYTAQHEYDQASQAYDRALAAAAPAERGTYALLAARFHLATTYELCEVGLPLAELAAHELSGDPTAMTTLAAHRYHCGQFAGAAAAARSAGDGPEATYYLGVALAALGERDAARATLISAADMAPASDWRRRAELALALLP